MSKSDPSDYSRINMTDDAETIALKFKKARTDPEPLPGDVAGLEGRAEAANLVAIYGALAGISRAEVLNRFGGQGFAVFKPALAELAVDKLGPIAAEMSRLMKEPGYIDGVLHRGAERANEIARHHMSELHRLIGMLRP
jgi:tryptophanyl-tRNA synthetase